MIKLSDNGSYAAIKTSTQRKSASGKLGDSIRTCTFNLDLASLTAQWKNGLLQCGIQCTDDVYIETVSLHLRVKSTKVHSKIIIWNEDMLKTFPKIFWGIIPFTRRSMLKGKGSQALWLSESGAREGLFFGQNPPADYPLCFRTHRLSRTVQMRWTVNRLFRSGEKIVLPAVRLHRCKRLDGFIPWQKEWVKFSSGNTSLSAFNGWLGADAIKSIEHIREFLPILKKYQNHVKWFAIQSDFIMKTGDWLELSAESMRIMSESARLIRDSGFIPGLHFSPLLVSLSSKIAAKHPDWLVMNGKNTPLNVPRYAKNRENFSILDSTHPEVKKRIRNVLDIMQNRWGYRVYVVENFEALSSPGIRQDQNIGNGNLLAETAQFIRSSLDERSTLIGMNWGGVSTAGIWDIQTHTPPIELKQNDQKLSETAFGIINRASWNGKLWLNALGPLPLELWTDKGSIAWESIRTAVLIASGAILFQGDPRKLDKSSQDVLQNFLEMFKTYHSRKLHIEQKAGQGNDATLIVSNNRGLIALFNFSSKTQEVRLDREELKTIHGIKNSLSAASGTVFNSPAIQVKLPPWGQRLFRG